MVRRLDAPQAVVDRGSMDYGLSADVILLDRTHKAGYFRKGVSVWLAVRVMLGSGPGASCHSCGHRAVQRNAACTALEEDLTQAMVRVREVRLHPKPRWKS